MTTVLADAPTTLRTVLTAGQGTAVAVSAVTVSGVVVLNGAAAERDASSVYADVWKVDWPATAGPDLVDVTWTWPDGVHREQVAVVGELYATPSTVRARTSVKASGKITDLDIDWTIDEIVASVEEYMGVAWVPRLSLVDVRLRDAERIVLPAKTREIRWATCDGVAATVSDYSEVTAWLPGPGRWRVAVEHGYDKPPADVRGAVLDVVARVVIDAAGSGTRNGRIAVAEGASYLVSQMDPTRGRLFGLPTADGIFNLHLHRMVAA